MKDKNLIRLPMQYFAEGEQTNPQGGEPAGAVENQTAQPNYEELIKTDKTLQSFLDSRVQSATTTAVQKALEKQRILSDEKATEAEKLAKMNKEEKQAYELKKAQDEIAKYKLQESVRGLKEEALKTANEKGVPVSMVELIPFAHIKAEEVNTHLDNLKVVYDKAVADGIAKALDGAGTPNGAGAEQTKVSSISSFMTAITENQAKRN